MNGEMWNTERVRQELGAKTIRSASTIILRLGLEPVSREPGRSGMNLYDAEAVRVAIAERRGAAGADLGQTSVEHRRTTSDTTGTETATDQRGQRSSSDHVGYRRKN
jgi:hypothetical protein